MAVVQRFDRGERPYQIADALGVARSSVFNWTSTTGSRVKSAWPILCRVPRRYPRRRRTSSARSRIASAPALDSGPFVAASKATDQPARFAELACCPGGHDGSIPKTV